MVTKHVKDFLDKRLQAGHDCTNTNMYKTSLMEYASKTLGREVTWRELSKANSVWRQKHSYSQEAQGTFSIFLVNL